MPEHMIICMKSMHRLSLIPTAFVHKVSGHGTACGRVDKVRLPANLEEEEEEYFHKLRPANKTDHLCQSWQ